MEVSLRQAIGLAMAAALSSGCGGSVDNTNFNPSAAVLNPPATVQAQMDQALLADPARALQFVPTDLLNPVARIGPKDPASSITVLPVSQLESDYETLFGSLSDPLGVTLNTRRLRPTSSSSPASQAPASSISTRNRSSTIPWELPRSLSRPWNTTRPCSFPRAVELSTSREDC